MNSRIISRVLWRTPSSVHATCRNSNLSRASILPQSSYLNSPCIRPRHRLLPQRSAFHTSPSLRAESPTANALMENLNDLYATAKDEFEIAAEETEKKTVYAADDREGAKDALRLLKEAFDKSVRESDPEVGREIQSRVGQRIRELENAVNAMEEMAMED